MKKRNEVYVVNTCNVWKWYSSFRLVGVFTSRKKLNPILNKMLNDKQIMWNDETCNKRFVNDLTDKELHNHIDYLSVQVITLNEKQ